MTQYGGKENCEDTKEVNRNSTFKEGRIIQWKVGLKISQTSENNHTRELQKSL